MELKCKELKTSIEKRNNSLNGDLFGNQYRLNSVGFKVEYEKKTQIPIKLKPTPLQN
jgi:hypothetical protein